MRYWLAGCLLTGFAVAFSLPLVWGRQRKVTQKSADVRFVSADGAFAFTYPSSLIKCEKDPKQENLWIPARSCEAVIPGRTYASLSKDATVACIAYPAETLSGTNFEAAAFTVNKLAEATADECLQVTEPHPAISHKEKVNAVTFDVFDVGGVAAGSLSAADAYRNFHQNSCYELDVRVAFLSMGAVDPGTLKEFDYDKVHRTLQSVLNTFKFLK
jgi:hypothetical protein